MKHCLTVLSTPRGLFGSMILAGFVLALAGCAVRVGPRTMSRDRFDYSGAISRSAKEQMLMNMVRLRYMDLPTFMDVAQVVAQYTFEASGSISAVDWNGVASGPAAGASGRWAESPTITYNPLTGEKFIKNLMRPVPPVALLSLVQAGWPVDAVFAVGVRTVNGLNAGSRTLAFRAAADPDFRRVVGLLRELQVSGAFGMRVEEEKEGVEAGVMFFQARPLDEALQAKAKEIKRLLRLSPDVHDFKIAFGSAAKDETEIAFLTRSMLEILAESAMGVEIPASDLDQGRATQAPPMGDTAQSLLIRVQSSPSKPSAEEAFTAIRYRSQWFWVSDRDLQSKRGLSFLLVLFALAGSGTTVAPPVLTISKP